MSAFQIDPRLLDNHNLCHLLSTAINLGAVLLLLWCVYAAQLHIAACSGYTRVMQLLIDHGASVDARDNDSWQPIHCAAYWAQVSSSVFPLLSGVY